LEPYGISLVPAQQTIWCPLPITTNDLPIMEIAVKHFSKKGSKMINRFRLFLQIISVYDLLIYKTNRMHPAYIKGEIPISQNSTIAWPAYPRPPKNYWKLWHSFIHFHIEPYVQKLPLQWNTHTSLHFSSSLNTDTATTYTNWKMIN